MTDETTAACVAEPMSEARIAELRTAAEVLARHAVDVRKGFDATHHLFAHRLLHCLSEIERQRAVIAERDVEIERLRGWFREIEIGIEPKDEDFNPDDISAWYQDEARFALAGEAVPDER